MSTFSELKEKLLRYIEVNIKLLKVNFIGRTASLLSLVIFAFICLFIFCCVVLFFGFGLTEVFVEAGISRMWSLFMTTGIFCAFLFIILLLRKNITNFLSGIFISAMTDDEAAATETENKNNSNPKA